MNFSCKRTALSAAPCIIRTPTSISLTNEDLSSQVREILPHQIFKKENPGRIAQVQNIRHRRDRAAFVLLAGSVKSIPFCTFPFKYAVAKVDFHFILTREILFDVQFSLRLS
ncbi:hypothetical protein CEXT_41431 [Caerostris extrusa]|uniref:Uncharacterized protein n=1 Tax=Caerostris extrusa TaxID=172846 RepID=A0AAV4P682_CAEEX|nr:hypothetical protein CEXT_41431 [Caerostris extrusa]